jgi:hypothetical protein
LAKGWRHLPLKLDKGRAFERIAKFMILILACKHSASAQQAMLGLARARALLASHFYKKNLFISARL